MRTTICGIYFIKSADNTVGYVGQSINIHRRWKTHQRKYLLSDGWMYSILEECPRKFLNAMEIHYIALMKCYGYVLDNKTLGGKQWALACAEETRRKMSAAAKNRSPEHLAKLSAAFKGKPLSEEHKRKLSEGQKNRAPRSDETKARMSDAQKGRTFSAEHRAKLSAAKAARRAKNKRK